MTPDLQIPDAETRLSASGLADKAVSVSAVSRLGVPQDAPSGRETDGLGQHALDRPVRGRLLDGGIENAAPRPATAPQLPLTAAQLDQLGALFKLLSDKTRLAILQLLCEGEMNVTALCRRLNLPQPTVSHHLGLLRMNRLIANRRSGKEVYYRLHERIVAADADDRASLDGVAGSAAERSLGLQVIDSGFSLQIAASGAAAAARHQSK